MKALRTKRCEQCGGEYSAKFGSHCMANFRERAEGKVLLGRYVERAETAESEVARLRLLLIDAEHLAREGISYTSDFFVKKWRMNERLGELQSALISTSAPPVKP